MVFENLAAADDDALSWLQTFEDIAETAKEDAPLHILFAAGREPRLLLQTINHLITFTMLPSAMRMMFKP